MKTYLKSQKKIILNFAWLVVQQYSAVIISAAINIFMVKYLKPIQYGRLEYVNSIISIAIVISSVGISNTLMYELTNDKQNTGIILGSAALLRFFFSILIYGILYFGCVYFENEKIICSMIRVQGLSLFFQIITLFSEWFLMESLSKFYVLMSMGALLLSGFLKLFFIYSGKPGEYFTIPAVIENALLFFAVFFYIRIKKPFRLSASVSCMFNIFKHCKVFIIADLSTILYNQIDKVMLNSMLGEYEVGIYTISSYIATFWQFIPLALINSTKATMIQKFHHSKAEFEKYMEKIFLITISICAIIIAFILLFGNRIILILYGSDYKEASSYLLVLGIGTVFSMLGSLGSVWILCNNANKYSSYRTAMGAILNLILNYFFIKKSGIWGASIATLITQFMASIIFTLLFSKTRRIIYIYINALKDIISWFKQFIYHI